MRHPIPTTLLAGMALLCLAGTAGADLNGKASAVRPLWIAQQNAHEGGHEHSGHKEGDGHARGADQKGHDHKEGEAHKGHDDHKEGDGHKHDEPAKAPDKRSDAGHDHDHGEKPHEHKTEESARHGEAGHDHGESEKSAHGHESHGGDAHGGHSDSVKLTAEQMKEFDIATEQARSGDINSAMIRPAEIKFNQDRVAHVVPRVAGVVRDVMASEGDRVSAGTVMALLESRELADAKAAYLAAFERAQLSRETFGREEGLWKQKISSEKEYLDAKSEYAERRIELRAASQKLIALGFDEAFLEKLASSDDDEELTRYSLVAPFGGTVITRHITRGEAIDSENQAFLLADLSDIWIDITVYPQDLGLVRKGQKVTFDLGEGIEPVRGRIDFVTPHVSDATRTASARTTISNPDGRLRPGMFVKAEIATGSENATIRIPRGAIQRFGEGSVVFVGKDGEFSPRPVRVGRMNGDFAEIVSGLESGETFVSQGAFTLKAQLSKESFGDGHNH